MVLVFLVFAVAAENRSGFGFGLVLKLLPGREGSGEAESEEGIPAPSLRDKSGSTTVRKVPSTGGGGSGLMIRFSVDESVGILREGEARSSELRRWALPVVLLLLLKREVGMRGRDGPSVMLLLLHRT